MPLVVPVQISARAIRRAFEVAEQWLAANRDGVNAINVYPVPDGDTGTNMLATWRAALRAAPEDPEHVGEFLAALSRGALLGARGNSGVILSQMVRGMAEALERRPSIDPHGLAEAMAKAADTAYAALSNPVEGTMLTVMRDAAEAAAAAVRTSNDVGEVLMSAVDAAYRSVERTPELLSTLRDAGVVDAGGMGVAVLIQGTAASLTGARLPESPLLTAGEHVDLSGVQHEGYGYCTEYVIEGPAIDRAALEAELVVAGGESIIVVGSSEAVHVHVHMNDPGPAFTAGVRWGALDNVKVENMQAQHDRWAEHRRESEAEEHPDPATLPAIGLVAVAPGSGIAETFRDLGAGRVLLTPESGKASAVEIMEAARRAGRNHAIVLPNDKDVLLAAEHAAESSEGFITVIPSRTVADGIAAAIVYMPEGDLPTMIEEMREASEAARCVEVSTAVRDATIDGLAVRTGDAIALVDGELVARSDDLEAVLLEGLHRAGAAEAEIVTLYLGDEADERAGDRASERIREVFPGVEVEVIDGHQPHYPYIACVE